MGVHRLGCAVVILAKGVSRFSNPQLLELLLFLLEELVLEVPDVPVELLVEAPALDLLELLEEVELPLFELVPLVELPVLVPEVPLVVLVPLSDVELSLLVPVAESLVPVELLLDELPSEELAVVSGELSLLVDAVSEIIVSADVATVPAPHVWLDASVSVGSYTVTEPSLFEPMTSTQCSSSVSVCAFTFTATNAPFERALVSSFDTVDSELVELSDELLLELLLVDSCVASSPSAFAALMNVCTSESLLELSDFELELVELELLDDELELLELLSELLLSLLELDVLALFRAFAAPAGVWSVFPVRPM